MRTLAAALAAAVVAVSIGRAGAPPAVAMVVRFDVAAVDARGRTIPNLTRNDFEVMVDGAPQPLESVALVDSSHRPFGRAFAIFLDEYHTRPAASAIVRSALARFVDTILTPDDRVIVMKPLDPLLSIPAARDLGEVRSAIASFDGRLGDYAPHNAFERDFMGRAPATIDRLRRQVTVSALNALAVRLGALGEARKSLLVVSNGFAVAPQARGEESLPTVASLVRLANRGNVAIYALDPADDSTRGDVLQSLAADTDGRSARLDPNDDGTLATIAADASGYYLLTYRPAVSADGRFHSVDVHVKRRDARVRARKGFWAMTPDEAIRLEPRRETPAEVAFERTPRHLSVLIRPWFGMTRAANGNTRITLVWEPIRRVPGDRSRAATPIEIAVTATARDGSTLYEGAVRPSGAVGESSDAAAKAVFDAPPGRLLLRMAITGSNAKPLDVDTRDLAVRDLRQPVAIGTPQILRARTARDFRALAADRDAAPVAAREFSRAERLIVRFAAYGPSGDPPAVTARLISRGGKTMRTLEPSALDRAASVSQIDVPLAGLAPGEYTLELAATSRAGSAKELVTFRVTG